jgi:5S rRNA maturation endonuclease (ribonuclease M5)
MTKTIHSLGELFEALPLNSNNSGPCPFCETGSVTTKNNIQFRGKDRFYLYPDKKAWGCRVCNVEKRGPNNSGWFPHDIVADKLGLEMSEAFKAEFPSSMPTELKPLEFLTYAQTLKNHKEVTREFWRGFGWTDETIDRFLLGWGKIDTYHLSGHLIPMDVTNTVDEETVPGFYTSIRVAGEKRKQRGSSRNYLWHIRDDEYLNTCALVEGEKDLITAYQLGHKNVACTFSNYWNDNFTKFIAQRYEKMTVYIDNDEAGERWLGRMVPDLLVAGIEVHILNWKQVEGAKSGEDLTDYYQRIKSNITCIENFKGKFIVKSPIVRVTKTHNNKIVPIELIRSQEPGSLHHEVHHFLANYTYKRGKGNALLLAVGPGAGKTHTLYKAAEEQARKMRVQRQHTEEQLQLMVDNLTVEVEGADDEHVEELQELLDNQEKLLEKFTYNSIAWYAPYKNGIDELLAMGADPKLWYNFQARNKDNCQSYDITQQLGENYHAIGGFCELSCPHYKECVEEGYLHQNTEMREYPIVFYRHEHILRLPPTSIELVIIDESLIPVVEDPINFVEEELDPFNTGWQLDVENDINRDILEFFVQSLRIAAAYNRGQPQQLPDKQELNPKYIIHGNQFYKILEKVYSNSGRDIAEIVALKKEDLNAYQPSYISGDQKFIKKRCVPLMHDAVIRELGIYSYDKKADRPSTINIVAGNYEVYREPRLKMPARMPVIIADATPMLELYQSIFDRGIRVYAPRFRNPNAEIIVVHGSDWTRNHVNSQLSIPMENLAKVNEEVGELLEGALPDDVPQILDGYMKSTVFQDIVYIVEHLKSKHDSVLMVTHKNLREFVESVLQGAYSETDKSQNKEKFAWGHYGGLRGTNKYKDFEALALIGAFRIPYDVMWRKAQLWAYGLGLQESVPQQLVSKNRDYHMSGVSTMGKYITFDHWLADKLVNHAEQGEMVQCAHRIRPHSSDERKVIYIFATRPVGDLATKLVEKSKFVKSIKETTYAKLVRFIKSQYEDTGKLPTYRTIRKKFKVSNTTIKEAREEAKGA